MKMKTEETEVELISKGEADNTHTHTTESHGHCNSKDARSTRLDWMLERGEYAEVLKVIDDP